MIPQALPVEHHSEPSKTVWAACVSNFECAKGVRMVYELKSSAGRKR